MFSVGQKVWHHDGQRSGTVLECDGDRVFIAQDNGVELDFRGSDLTSTPPPSAKASEAMRERQEGGGQVSALRDAEPHPDCRRYHPEHSRVLGIVHAHAQAIAPCSNVDPRPAQRA